MVFSDPAFISVFLPSVLLLYWVGGWRVRNLFLVVVGLLFYTVGGQAMVILLGVSIVVNFLSALAIQRLRSRSLRAARGICVVAVAANIGVLIVWKYAAFASRGITSALSSVGVAARLQLDLALPIAISFYTFQSVSYLIDVWKGTVRPARRLVDYAACILLFPHLIAGPIVRFAEIENDLGRVPRHRTSDFALGLPRFFWGLAKKVLIADQVAGIANAAFDTPRAELTTAVAWIGAISFAVQIYFDFSGYSDMAVGLARMFGFRFPENFDRPYSALSVTDFWRRWHMSLSSWFRDYVYVPLGGNRRGRRRTYVNLWTVFLLTGLWHGAALTFVIWGVFHGALLVIERITGLGITAAGDRGTISLVVRRGLTFILVCVGWVFFRADSVLEALQFALRLFVPYGTAVPPLVAEYFSHQRMLVFVGALAIVVLPRSMHVGRMLSDGTTPRAATTRRLIMVLVAPVALLYTLSGTFSPFLYFKF